MAEGVKKATTAHKAQKAHKAHKAQKAHKAHKAQKAHQAHHSNLTWTLSRTLSPAWEAAVLLAAGAAGVLLPL